jgi:hypothetical protein
MSNIVAGTAPVSGHNYYGDTTQLVVNGNSRSLYAQGAPVFATVWNNFATAYPTHVTPGAEYPPEQYVDWMANLLQAYFWDKYKHGGSLTYLSGSNWSSTSSLPVLANSTDAATIYSFLSAAGL